MVHGIDFFGIPQIIFNIFVSTYIYHDAGQVLRHFVKSVLEAAHKRSLKTLAFPCVGTGVLSFPPEVVASCMFNECDKFSASYSQTTVSEVRIVVYEKDQSTFDVYLDLTRFSFKLRRPTVLTSNIRIVPTVDLRFSLYRTTICRTTSSY